MREEERFRLPEWLAATYRITLEAAEELAGRGNPGAAEQWLCLALRQAEEAAKDRISWGEPLAEIRGWISKTQAAFEFTVEPLRVEQQGGETVVTWRTTGTFPGSPVDLRHFIMLEGDRIAALTIRV